MRRIDLHRTGKTLLNAVVSHPLQSSRALIFFPFFSWSTVMCDVTFTPSHDYGSFLAVRKILCLQKQEQGILCFAHDMVPS
jgi:hypothetical protein